MARRIKTISNINNWLMERISSIRVLFIGLAAVIAVSAIALTGGDKGVLVKDVDYSHGVSSQLDAAIQLREKGHADRALTRLEKILQNEVQRRQDENYGDQSIGHMPLIFSQIAKTKKAMGDATDDLLSVYYSALSQYPDDIGVSGIVLKMGSLIPSESRRQFYINVMNQFPDTSAGEAAVRLLVQTVVERSTVGRGDVLRKLEAMAYQWADTQVAEEAVRTIIARYLGSEQGDESRVLGQQAQEVLLAMISGGQDYLALNVLKQYGEYLRGQERFTDMVSLCDSFRLYHPTYSGANSALENILFEAMTGNSDIHLLMLGTDTPFSKDISTLVKGFRNLPKLEMAQDKIEELYSATLKRINLSRSNYLDVRYYRAVAESAESIGLWRAAITSYYELFRIRNIKDMPLSVNSGSPLGIDEYELSGGVYLTRFWKAHYLLAQGKYDEAGDMFVMAADTSEDRLRAQALYDLARSRLQAKRIVEAQNAICACGKILADNAEVIKFRNDIAERIDKQKYDKEVRQLFMKSQLADVDGDKERAAQLLFKLAEYEIGHKKLNDAANICRLLIDKYSDTECCSLALDKVISLYSGPLNNKERASEYRAIRKERKAKEINEKADNN